MNRPLLTRASATFVQDGNTMGTTSDCEEITVRLESQLPGEEPFFVIETEGWSCEYPSELKALLLHARTIWNK